MEAVVQDLVLCACKKILEPFLRSLLLSQRPMETLSLTTTVAEHWPCAHVLWQLRHVRSRVGVHSRQRSGWSAADDGRCCTDANYIRPKLEDTFELQYKTRSLHEVVFFFLGQAPGEETV